MPLGSKLDNSVSMHSNVHPEQMLVIVGVTRGPLDGTWFISVGDSGKQMLEDTSWFENNQIYLDENIFIAFRVV